MFGIIFNCFQPRTPSVKIVFADNGISGYISFNICSPRDPRFAGSNPAEVDGFFQYVKIPSTSPPGETFKPSEISGSLKNLKPEKIDL